MADAPLMSSLVKLFRLASPDRALLIEAWILQAATRVGLSLFALPRLQKILACAAGQKAGSVDTPRLVWAINVAGRYVPHSTCLVRALAGQALLRRRGQESSLHLGVALTESKGFEAHAWLEHRGQVILGESEAGRFTPLTRVNA